MVVPMSINPGTLMSSLDVHAQCEVLTSLIANLVTLTPPLPTPRMMTVAVIFSKEHCQVICHDLFSRRWRIWRQSEWRKLSGRILSPCCVAALARPRERELI